MTDRNRRLRRQPRRHWRAFRFWLQALFAAVKTDPEVRRALLKALQEGVA